MTLQPTALDLLQTLTDSEKATLALAAEYTASTGRGCFTYKGLRAYYTVRKYYNYIEWHTVERSLRKLAEANILKRIYPRKKTVIFCMTDRAREIATALPPAPKLLDAYSANKR